MGDSAVPIGGAAACILISLLTPQIPPEKLQLFYDLSRTPIRPGETVLSPCTMPVDVSPAPRPMLIATGGLEIPMPSKTSMLGFLAGWVAVGAMVVGFYWLVSD